MGKCLNCSTSMSWNEGGSVCNWPGCQLFSGTKTAHCFFPFHFVKAFLTLYAVANWSKSAVLFLKINTNN